jgi:hypothetical protein
MTLASLFRANSMRDLGWRGPKLPASRNLTLVTSLARGHTEACINILFGILSNADAPVLARIKAAKILRVYGPYITEKARRNVPLAEDKTR